MTAQNAAFTQEDAMQKPTKLALAVMRLNLRLRRFAVDTDRCRHEPRKFVQLDGELFCGKCGVGFGKT